MKRSLPELLEQLQKKRAKYAINDSIAGELGTRAHQYIVDKSSFGVDYMELQDCKARAQAFMFVQSIMNDRRKTKKAISPYVCFEQLMQFGVLARGRVLDENKARYFASFDGYVAGDEKENPVMADARAIWELIEPLVKKQERVEVATLSRYLEELDLAIKSGQLKPINEVPEAQVVQAR